MRLSHGVAYGIRAILELSRGDHGIPVRSSHLAATGHIPEKFLPQVLRQLVTCRILRSTLGRNGGFSMDRKPAEISLLDVIEAIDGPIVAAIPPFRSGERPDDESNLRAALEKVTSISRRELQAIKLSDLFGPSVLPEDLA
jgi:Rrf2 family protein